MMKKTIITLAVLLSFGASAMTAEAAYIANRNTGKIHEETCRSVSVMKASNKVYIGTLAEAKASGYTPCARCRPF